MALSIAVLSITFILSVIGVNGDDAVAGRMGSSSEVDAFYAGHYGGDPFVQVDVYLKEFADGIGFPVDQIRTIGCLFLAYPIALGHRCLPNAPIKHLYSIFWGFGFSWLCFGVNTLVPLAVALLTYAGAFVLPSKSFPLIVFVLAMGVLSGMHLYRLMIDYGGYSLDVTGPLMIITLKVIAFAYNVHDTHHPNAKYASRAGRAVDMKDTNLIEFMGFIFFFGGFLAGPTFEFADYRAFTNLSLHAKDTERPSFAQACLPAMTQVLLAFGCMAVYVGLAGPYFPIAYLFSDTFMTHPLPMRCAYTVVAVGLQRFKYYFVWSLASGACVLGGLGYNGKDTKTGSFKWDRCNNANLLSVETGQSPRGIMTAWNVSVNKFLRYYVYERAQEAGCTASLSTLATFMVSGFWHGFYGGYYVSFFVVGFITTYARQIRSNLRAWFEDRETRTTPFWYNMLGMVMTHMLLNMFLVPFMVLSLSKSYEVYTRIAFAPYVIGATIVALMEILKMQGFQRKRVKEYKAATSKKAK